MPSSSLSSSSTWLSPVSPRLGLFFPLSAQPLATHTHTHTYIHTYTHMPPHLQHGLKPRNPSQNEQRNPSSPQLCHLNTTMIIKPSANSLRLHVHIHVHKSFDMQRKERKGKKSIIALLHMHASRIQYTTLLVHDKNPTHQASTARNKTIEMHTSTLMAMVKHGGQGSCPCV